MSSNLLRGAFGTVFRSISCPPDCAGPQTCKESAGCPYARFFEPSAQSSGPSGLTDSPRPFVFRATHLDGMTFHSGNAFSFDMNLFEVRSAALAYLIVAFAQMAREGFGPGRGRAILREVTHAGARIYDGEKLLLGEPPAPVSLSLDPPALPVERLTVRFLTPTELKSAQKLADRPEFGVLAARVRDRLSTLRELYGDGPLPIDFRAFGERATRIQMTRCVLHRMDASRRSSRTGQTHSIGGFVGEADYEGDLTEFVPYLEAARWTGVGRQTVWGKGEIETRV